MLVQYSYKLFSYGLLNAIYNILCQLQSTETGYRLLHSYLYSQQVAVGFTVCLSNSLSSSQLYLCCITRAYPSFVLAICIIMQLKTNKLDIYPTRIATPRFVIFRSNFHDHRAVSRDLLIVINTHGTLSYQGPAQKARPVKAGSHYLK